MAAERRNSSGRLRGVLICVFMLLAPSLMAAEPLQRIGDAVRMTNYSGVMVYHQGDRMETMRIVHRYRDGLEQERLRALSGEPIEFLRDGAKITCILPRDREVMVDLQDYTGLLTALPEQASLALEQGLYEASETADSDILGRSCRQVNIRPVDGYRYGYRLWVDAKTGLPLKTQLLSTEGAVLEQAMFTEISFPEEIDDLALAPTLETEGFVRMRHEPMPDDRSSPSQWRATSLPQGFRLLRSVVKHMSDPMGNVEQLVYSDGIASVSVYVAENHKDLDAFVGMTEMGATSAYGEMRDGMHFAAVGEVPGRTVEMIVRGMRRDLR